MVEASLSLILAAVTFGELATVLKKAADENHGCCAIMAYESIMHNLFKKLEEHVDVLLLIL